MSYTGNSNFYTAVLFNVGNMIDTLQKINKNIVESSLASRVHNIAKKIFENYFLLAITGVGIFIASRLTSSLLHKTLCVLTNFVASAATSITKKIFAVSPYLATIGILFLLYQISKESYSSTSSY